MQPLLELLKRCAEGHSFDSGDPDCKTVLDQLYRAYAESHENDPPGIRDGFKELENFLEVLPLDDNKLRRNSHSKAAVIITNLEASIDRPLR